MPHNVWQYGSVAAASRWHVFLQGAGAAVTCIFYLFVGLAKTMTPRALAGPGGKELSWWLQNRPGPKGNDPY